MSRKSRYYRIKGRFGVPQDKQYTYEEYAAISHYYENTRKPEESVIDDITWNDLDMDSIFLMINHSYSAVGRDYLYKLMRMPSTNRKELDERERLIQYFDTHEEERTEIEMIMEQVGFTRKISISDHMDRLFKLKRASNFFHILVNLLVIGSILFTIFVDPIIGILAILFSVGMSIISYYKTKNSIDSFFTCVGQLVNMLQAAKKISTMNIAELEPYNERLRAASKTFGNVRRGAWLLANTKELSGSLETIVLEYFRMFTHADLMKFNSMVGNIGNHKEEVFDLMETLGYLEAMISIASYRRVMPYYCVPEFSSDFDSKLELSNVYHVEIERPVANSISEARSVLVTGSNASGKSTFLKSVALAAIMAQTIHTVPAEHYAAPFYRIYSSMALADHLESGDSYYIVEIKSLKRIVDASRQEGARILCFIDEVLRGTNTVERIAASSQILKDLASHKVMCFAATHDIELTEILKNYYSNYHFAEEFVNDTVCFNYELREGKATSRNAIRLLGVLGYDEEIIQESQAVAEQFMKDGRWETCQ